MWSIHTLLALIGVWSTPVCLCVFVCGAKQPKNLPLMSVQVDDVDGLNTRSVTQRRSQLQVHLIHARLCTEQRFDVINKHTTWQEHDETYVAV